MRGNSTALSNAYKSRIRTTVTSKILYFSPPVSPRPSSPLSSSSLPASSSIANMVSASKLRRCNGEGLVGIGAGSGLASLLKSSAEVAGS